MYQLSSQIAGKTRRGDSVPMKYSFKCICGVIINADTEIQLEALLKRHAKNSNIHKIQGWAGHSGIADGR
jgi:hypothetical protein